MGFKLSALRLADTCLVISKHSIRNQLGIQYVSLGLISRRMLRDFNSKTLVSIVVVYQLKNNESFIPLTPFPEDVVNYILKYCRGLFKSELAIKRFVLNNMDKYSGTKVFLLDLATREGIQELLNEGEDIKLNPKWQEQYLLSVRVPSLMNYLKLMYI